MKDQISYNSKPISLFCKVLLIFFIISISISAGCKKDNPHKNKLKVAGIVFQDDQYMRLVLFGMKQMAEKSNVEFLQGCSYNKPEKELELINTYIAMGVNAIIITPISSRSSITALKMAYDKGIKVITFNTKVDADIYSAHVQCSDSSMGAQAGLAARKYIIDNLGGKAKIAILAFKSQLAEQSNERVNNFKNQLSDMPGIEFVAEQDAWLTEQAIKKAGDILTAHPETDIIFSANEGGCVGSVMAVKNAHKARKIGVFGIGASEQLDEFLLSNDNILQAIIDASPFEVGSLALERFLQVKQGIGFERVVSLPGVLLSRTDPEAVKAFDKKLKESISRSAK